MSSLVIMGGNIHVHVILVVRVVVILQYIYLSCVSLLQQVTAVAAGVWIVDRGRWQVSDVCSDFRPQFGPMFDKYLTFPL